MLGKFEIIAVVSGVLRTESVHTHLSVYKPAQASVM
jgi:hypothetical protein